MCELQREDRLGLTAAQKLIPVHGLSVIWQKLFRMSLPFAPAVSLAAMLVYPFWYFRSAGSDEGFYLDCLFRRCSGIACPFCGFTRSMAAMYGGDLRQAFLFNPFTPIWLAFMLYLIVVFIRRRRQSPELLNKRELHLFALFFALSWAAKLIVGQAYY